MDLKKNLKLSSLMLLVTGVVACGDSDKFNFDTPPVAVNPPPAEETVEVKAENDSAEDVNGSTGATAVVNVLANDTIDGEAATTSNVDLEVVTADAEGVLTLSAEGNVDVSANSVAGSYSLEYQICEKGTSNCDSATATVAVVTTEIVAVDDLAENANGTNGETAVVNVLDNDTFGGAAVVIDAVDLSEVTPDPSGSLTLNADGSVDLASGTANGDYQLTYQICEKGTENCAQATVTVTVDMMTGVFMKGMGQGVAFETDSMSGMTNDLGQYSYLAGENITFSIGATVLGETVEAQADLDVTDLIPGVVVPQDVVGTKQLVNDLWRQYGNDGDVRRKQFELINMMSLLSTVDKDKDFSNGIQIDPKLHDALGNKAFSFKKRLYSFGTQPGLRKSLMAAYNNNAIDNARIITQFKSLDYLYDYLGLEKLVFARVEYLSDYQNDGTIDHHSIYTYDSRLLLSSQEDVLRGYTYSYVYNDFGQRELYLDNNSGYTYKNTYNIHGQQTSYEYDSNGDGVPERMTTYEYDEHGNQVKYENDNNGDGIIDSTYHYEYDENGYKTLQTEDNNGDGTINRSWSYSYDAQGNMTLQAYDNNADGTVDNEYTYEYDARGNQISQSNDENGDGVAERIYIREYDANNNTTMWADDYDADGAFDWVQYQEYDVNGNVISYRYDQNGDGTINRETIYEYDSNQAMTLQTHDTNADGVIDSQHIYVNDSNGAVTRQTYDSNADGTPEQINDYVNDIYGNPLSQANDNNADGTIDYYYEYVYQQINFTSYYNHH